MEASAVVRVAEEVLAVVRTAAVAATVAVISVAVHMVAVHMAAVHMAVVVADRSDHKFSDLRIRHL